MLDWLRRDPREVPEVAVAGRSLPVEIRRNHRARRLTMRLSPDGSAVLLTIPAFARTAEALAFAQSRADWLAQQLSALPPPRTLGDGAQLPFRGELLVIRHDPARRRRPAVIDGALHVGGAAESLPARLTRWMRAEAQALLAEDLAHFCDRAGRPVPPLALSGAQRRWGSCSARGVVRINWRLAMAPDFVRRSVVAHEVAHLVHFDHSPQFHALLAALYGDDIKPADRWLKREGRGLYTHLG